jgi:hypothetical protein
VPAHVRRKVYALVQEVRHLQLYLQHHHYPDAAVRRQRSAVLNGLSWVLDQVGFPPARYDEVLRDYAPVKVRERRTRTRAKDEWPKDDLDRLAKSMKLLPSPIRQMGDKDCPYVLVVHESMEPLANEQGIFEGDVIRLRDNPGWWRVVFSRYIGVSS